MTAKVSKKQLVNPGTAADAGSVCETKFLDYPLVVLEKTLPSWAWEPISDYLPASPAGEVETLCTLLISKWATVTVKSALYMDSATAFVKSAPENMKNLDSDKLTTYANEAFTLLTGYLAAWTETLPTSLQGPAQSLGSTGLALFESMKGRAVVLSERFGLQEKWNNFDLQAQYTSLHLSWKVIKESVQAFITETWEQLENVKANPSVQKAKEFGRETWVKIGSKAHDFQENSATWHEASAWMAFAYAAASEKVALFQKPSE